jgi:MFS family permease
MNSTQTYGKAFWLLCLNSFFFFLSFSLLLGELPQYLTLLGGAEYKGWIIGLFTISALIGRLYSGRWSDKFGRKPMILIGCIAAAFSGLGYVLFVSIAGFLAVRFFHGFSTGFGPTGTTAMLSDIIPENKRGEAMGVLGFCIQIGMALGPYLGTEIAQKMGMNSLFNLSTLMAFVSLALIFTLPETLPAKRKFEPRDLVIYLKAIYEPQVIFPMLVMLFSVILYGAIVTVLPDVCMQLGFDNKSSFMLAVTLASMVVRIFAGKWSDRWGRIPIVFLGLGLQLVSTLFLLNIQNQTDVLVASAIYGMGTGILSPVLFAWAVDQSDPQHRGRALSSLYIAMEAGIGTGAIVAAQLFKNSSSNVSLVFGMTSISIFLGLFFALVAWKKKRNGIA